MFIPRDFSLDVITDYYCNVVPRLGVLDGAIPRYNADGELIYWEIKQIYQNK